MSDFRKANDEISKSLSEIEYDGDASDIGNEIGVILGKYIDENNPGWDLDSFIVGIKHGISISDNSHYK